MTAKEDLASRHRNAALQRQSFNGGDLASVHLQQLWFTRCSFRGADLRHATLDGCHFKLCDLRGANLRGASLRGVSLAGCDLAGADLREADLTGARFGQVLTGIPPHGLTNATGIKLDNAVLRDLELDQVIGWPIAK
ncbi:pentapeptide repeat-containing protein (plasmid) [Streptomyces anulatus]|uniref:Pentapeptide repeat-containing protein n=1 Tax=Streptomyces anulatus TaxID=1892 RepID=A0ABZ1ZSZ4_STRAQ|nr:pentapeptide repeat-containing protein [Streptomyces anulatus]WSV80061.1 pentapeptide repeat-containing protein [Streptomyces anulatus]